MLNEIQDTEYLGITSGAENDLEAIRPVLPNPQILKMA